MRQQALRLAGTAEAAKIIEVTRQAIADRRRYRPYSMRDKRPVFPEPVAELACGPIWLVEDLQRYKRAYARFTRQGG